MAQTLYDKLWQSHVVHQENDGTALIYIDRHLVHEVTSPQAFEGLKLAGRKPWRVSSIVATADHNTPTNHWDKAEGTAAIDDPIARLQVDTLDANIRETGSLAYFPFKDLRQGIVHVVGPENGATLPGMTVVCGDSHTSTHGAFACMAHGIGTSEVEHVMATQCLVQKKSKAMLIRVDGALGKGVTAKDVALAIIGTIGPILEDKFTEEELKQLVAWLDSPVSRKYQQIGGEMQKALSEPLIRDSRATVEPKMRALEESLMKRLGHAVTHELIKFVIDPDSDLDPALFVDALETLKALHRFWIEVALSTGGFLLPDGTLTEDADAEEVTPLSLMILQQCIDAYLDGLPKPEEQPSA